MLKTRMFCWLFLCLSIFGSNIFAFYLADDNYDDNSFVWGFMGFFGPKENIGKNDNKDGQQQIASNEVGSDKLSHSMINQFANDVDNAYTKAKELFSKDPSSPLISHLVKSQDQSFWQGLIKYGFQKKQFSENDVWWVIKEFAKPNYLSKNEAKKLFDMIITNKEDKNKGSIIPLLTKISIPQVGWTSDKTQKSWGMSSHSEFHNILLEVIEQGYIEAFERILYAFPNVTDIFAIDSCKREELEKSINAGWLSKSYEYSPKTYSLIAWLTRSEAGVENYYLDRCKGKANNNYIEVLKIIMYKILNDETKTIDNNLYNLILLLWNQKDLISIKRPTTKSSTKIAKN